MSRLMMGISGALALSLAFGAAEFARGRDLLPIAGNSAPITLGLSSSSASREGLSAVNRSSKADRAAVPSAARATTRTVSLKLDGFADTTFLVRIPIVTANPPAASRPAAKPPLRKTMVACEPVVSILAEVAKRLDPGRCIT